MELLNIIAFLPHGPEMYSHPFVKMERVPVDRLE
jgi:hypothetical protein